MDGRRWDVVDVDYGVPRGHEQGKTRPAIVVSNDGFNRRAGMATVVAITSREPPKYPSEVALPDLPGIVHRGVILIQQIRTIDCDRIVRRRGRVEDPVLRREIEEALAQFLDLPSPEAE